MATWLVRSLTLALALTAAPASAQLLAAQDRPLSAIERTRLTSIESQLGRISAQRNTSLAALRTIALAMGSKFTALNPEQVVRVIDERAVELNAARARIQQMQGQLDAMDSMKLAKAVSPILTQATAAIDAGKLNDADTLLAQAAARFAGARTDLQARVDQIGAQEAAVLAQQAGVRAALSDFTAAAALYAKAAMLTAATTPETAWGYRIDQSNMLLTAGLEGGSGAADSLAALREQALPLAPRDVRPELFSATQYRIGATMFMLAHRANSTDGLREAIGPLQLAADTVTPATPPADAAARKSRLALAQAQLGERTSNPALVQSAMTAMRDLEGAGAASPAFLSDHSLIAGVAGAVLALAGDKPGSIAASRKSVDLSARIAGFVNRETQLNLWLQAKANHVFALDQLARRTGDPADARAAIAAAQAVLPFASRTQNPYYWALVRMREGGALLTLNQSGPNDPASLQAALTAFGDAATVLTRDAWAPFWGRIHRGMGDVRTLLARHQPVPATYAAALADYRTAAEVQTRTAAPAQWTGLQLAMANTLLDRAAARIETRAALAEADAILTTVAPVIAAQKLATLDAQRDAARARLKTLR